MKIIELQQGSDVWHQHRATARNASDASAMMACSPYKTRAQLLQERATGIKPDVDAATQARFARGHEIEAQARAIAEEKLGQELFPVIGMSDDGYLSASFDGITMDETTIVEIKSWNESKAADIRDGKVPEADRWQVVQQLVVSGADACMYIVTDGTSDKWEWLTVHLAPEDEAALRAGWEQFDADLASWQPTEPAAPVQAAPMESLPAVVVQVSGALTVGGNLDAFGQALRSFIERIPLKPATDQQFADAEAACKALKKAEDALTQAEDGALAQISDVEVMRRTVADLKELARSTRLATEKLVKAEKDARRTEKVMAARQAFETHVTRLQMDIKGVRLIVPAPDFGGAIKGLSSLASIDEKLTAALIAGKAEANTIVGRITNNLRTLDSVPAYAYLFADRQELAYKDAETLELLMQKRVDAEATRIEAERERIRQEEERKAREAAATEPAPGKPTAPVPTAAAPVGVGTCLATSTQRKEKAMTEEDDKRLLEMAAQAAGIEHGSDRLECGLSLTDPDGRHLSLPRWNPLDDDGDALRLAMKLGIDLEWRSDARVAAYRHTNADGYCFTAFESSRENRAKNTRRAIVRAAAAIGEAMP